MSVNIVHKTRLFTENYAVVWDDDRRMPRPTKSITVITFATVENPQDCLDFLDSDYVTSVRLMQNILVFSVEGLGAEIVGQLMSDN